VFANAVLQLCACDIDEQIVQSGPREALSKIFFCGPATIENMLCHTDREFVDFTEVGWLDGVFLDGQTLQFPTTA
jgi:hypothetical protein